MLSLDMVNDTTNGVLGHRNMIDTKNFKAKEFSCPCCGLNNMSQVMVETLQRIRDKVKAPIIITSGCRCPSHNDDVGGKKKSAHMKGTAVDIAVAQGNSRLRYNLISYAISEGIDRIGIYDTWIHLDIEPSLTHRQMWV